MAIKYERFQAMLNHYFKNNGRITASFRKEFSRFIRMAGYLEDVNVEAGRISEEYEALRKEGLVRI